VLASLGLALVVSVILMQVATFSTTNNLHRCATHKALILHPAVEWMFKFALWLTTGQCTKEWVAVHRKHHAFTDEEGDPHSPKIEGFWKVQLGNVFYYVREIKNTDVVERYARDIKDGWWDRHVFNRGLVGLIVGTGALCVVVGSMIGVWWALLAAGIHAVVFVFVLSSSINGLCHHVGYKNFDNTATNIRTLALLTGGEGLHNNHHGFPRSPKFSFRASEIDPAWPFIKLLILLKLAKPYKTIEEIAA
jgi:stearoyl-CoA desaturase (delta-9 desaturase)